MSRHKNASIIGILAFQGLVPTVKSQAQTMDLFAFDISEGTSMLHPFLQQTNA